MSKSVALVCSAMMLLAILVSASLSVGATWIPLSQVYRALAEFDDHIFFHNIIVFQRLPRVLIAMYAGSVMAAAGLMLQGLTRNPLASPAILGINAGAALFVIAGTFWFDISLWQQGIAALMGALAGFAATITVARLAGGRHDPRKLALILSGALVSLLFSGLSQAILLSDPSRRMAFLGWATGNVNHVYADRLWQFWWLGLVMLAVLIVLARPLTLITLGEEQAAATGVDVDRVSKLTFAAIVLGVGSAVAICGPIGFIGLVAPHMVRPFAGANFQLALPVCAIMGAAICVAADLIARFVFAPYVVHTAVVLDLIGGVVFVVIVRQFYLRPKVSGGR